MAVEHASLWSVEASSSLIITRQLPGDKADEVLHLDEAMNVRVFKRY